MIRHRSSVDCRDGLDTGPHSEPGCGGPGPGSSAIRGSNRQGLSASQWLDVEPGRPARAALGLAAQHHRLWRTIATPLRRRAVTTATTWSLIDLQDRKVVDRQSVRQSWFGLAIAPQEGQIWWSGGGGNLVHTFHLAGGRIEATPNLNPEIATAQALAPAPAPVPLSTSTGRERSAHFRGGVAFDAQRKVVYSLDVDGGTISAFDRTTRRAIRSAHAGTRPYDVAVGPGGNHLFVSDWAGRCVRVLEPGELRTARADRRRRAPQPDRRPSQGRPDLRRLRVEQLRVGHRHPPRDRHRDDPHGPLSAGAGGQHARRRGRRSRRQDALRGQRRQQLRRGDRHRRAGPEPGQGLHPDRLVSDRGGRHARRQAALDRRRQGEPDQGRTRREPAKPKSEGDE